MSGTGIEDQTAPERQVPRLRVRLLGGFGVDRAGAHAPEARWPRAAARDLVKLLAVSPGHQLHREQVMAVCWPDAGPEAAQRNLRVTLHAARRALEPDLAPRAASSYLVTDGVLLRLTALVDVDADDAERGAADALRAGEAVALASALARFTGELLPEDRYADWARARREHLADLRRRLRVAHGEALLADGSAEEAVEAAQDLLDADPADERAHRLAMEAYLAKGLRRQALRQYHRCRQALAAELGVRPDAATERLHRRALGAGTEPVRAATHRYVPAPLRDAPPGRTVGHGSVVDGVLGDDPAPVALVGGEAGLGKTRWVTETARRAVDAGWTVLWGAGHEAEGSTPYGLVVEALDAWLSDAPVARRADVAVEHPDLAAVLPSLGLAETASSRSPEEERLRLFRAVGALLDELAATAPVLVVFDDVHAGDLGSLQLVGHLARRAAQERSAVRFVVTFRDDELDEDDPRRGVLTGLGRAGLARVVDLGRLSRADVDVLVTDTLGRDPGERVRERVWELSLGNPLFAVELAREVERREHEDDRGPAGTGDDPADIAAPRGVRQLVAERLSRLEPAARRVAEVVAVAGDGVSLSEAVEVAAEGLHPGMSAARASSGAEGAVLASVLVEREVAVDGRTVPGLAFRHPLVRVTCYERLSSARRRQIHAAYSDAVLRRRPDAVDTLAGHLARADDPRAVDYLRRAAERAAALGANDTADRYYLQLTERLDRAVADAARARVDRSAVLQRMGRYPEAVRILREAVDDLARREEPDLLAEAAGRLAESLARARDADTALVVLETYALGDDVGPHAVAIHRLGSALAYLVVGRYADAVVAATAGRAAAGRVLGPDRRGLLARASSLLASAYALDGRFVEAGRAADQALPHAEAFGDQHILGSVLSVQREQARRSGRLGDALAAGARALELAERTGNAADVSFELANVAELHLLRDDVAQAAAAVDRALVELAGLEAWSVPYVLVAGARVGMRTGSPDVGERAAAARAAADARGDRQAVDEALVVEVEHRLESGDTDGAVPLLDEVRSLPTEHLRARLDLAAGRADVAVARSAAELARTRGAGERVLEAVVGGVHAAALRAAGDPGAAAAA
ncbi:ATP-binding protein, partial [Isoptericola hypogeus]